MSDFPVCSNEKCNTKIERNVSNIYNGYKVNSNFTYCCHKCAVSSEANKKLHEKTCLERYGVTSYTKTHECKQKIVSTSLKNYGTTNPGCSVQALEKIRQTNLRKRGVPCSFQSEEVKQKSKASFIRHYGVDNNMKSKEGLKAYQDAMQKKYGEGIISNFQLESTKEKSRKTKLRRHGDENYVNVDKMKQTKLERHGDPDYNNQEKFVKTMNERYGVDSPQQCPSIRAKSGYRYVYNGVRFDSGPEIAYYIWLSDNNIEFTY